MRRYISALSMMFEGMKAKQPKETAAQRRKTNRKDHYTPPRSMTEAEREYYAKHKHLHGFNN
jgi:hypothetical protein